MVSIYVCNLCRGQSAPCTWDLRLIDVPPGFNLWLIASKIWAQAHHLNKTCNRSAFSHTGNCHYWRTFFMAGFIGELVSRVPADRNQYLIEGYAEFAMIGWRNPFLFNLLMIDWSETNHSVFTDWVSS